MIVTTVCGSHALSSAVRKAIRYPRMVDILKGGPTISLHVEGFGNAVSKDIFTSCRSTHDHSYLSNIFLEWTKTASVK